MKRVSIWNGGVVPEELGGGTRGNTEFNPAFDMGLLSEEVKEFYSSMANNDIVEMIDAVCDTRFVYEGIKFKYGMISYGYGSGYDLRVVEDNTKAYKIIENYYFHHMNIMFEVLESLGITGMHIQNCYNFVCEANEQKGTKKDEKGKTMKGSKWVNPAEKIKNYLAKCGIQNDKAM